MRIGPNIPDFQGVSTDRTESSLSASRTNDVSAAESEGYPEDTVTISALTAKALQTPEVRQEKVDSLRQSVASGQYQLDPNAIAEAMVSQA